MKGQVIVIAPPGRSCTLAETLRLLGEQHDVAVVVVEEEPYRLNGQATRAALALLDQPKADNVFAI